MTQEFKGTKGKWATVERYDDKRNQPVIEIDASEDYQESIITVWSGLDKGDKIDEETLANALLIAHAPEMLERLKEQNIDLEILKSNLIEASKGNARFKGYPDQVQKWIDANNELITKATTI